MAHESPLAADSPGPTPQNDERVARLGQHTSTRTYKEALTGRSRSSSRKAAIAFPSIEVSDESQADTNQSTAAQARPALQGHSASTVGSPKNTVDDASSRAESSSAVAGSTSSAALQHLSVAGPSTPSGSSSWKSKRTGTSNLEELLSKEADPSPQAQKALVPARLSELKRFTLYETRTRFYLVAYNVSQTAFRILKLDRIPEKRESEERHSAESQDKDSDSVISSLKESSLETHPSEGQTSNPPPTSKVVWELHVTADRVDYTRTQKSELLDMISEGNKSTGGLKEVGKYFGIVGFIRFTSTYYMVLISRRSVVGLLGGHYIYHCDETQIIPVCPPSVLAAIGGRSKALDQEEARLLHTFKQVDLGKNFYFSYTYDLTKTLQDNLTSAPATESDPTTAWGYSEKFVWNHHLLLPAFAASEHTGTNDPTHEWVLPLVYGFVDQAKLRVLNSTIQVTLIARRSRHFAGARFLKRGTDERGHVANDVETEQIVCDALTTPFHAPLSYRGRRTRSDTDKSHSQKLGPNPRYTSYVMHRGSIPIYWTQDSNNMSPRPPIEISVVDPYYSSAALHFDDMFRRYGSPIIILNLIKSKEKQPREVRLLEAFGECVKYLNQFLPAEQRMRYIAWDMSRASKSRDQDVIGVLEDIAEETITTTRFFHSGPEPARFEFSDDKPDPILNGKYRDTILLQSGVARVNCVDCLDRTNAAQFVIGKAAFGHQLYALGLLDHPRLPFDSDAIDMLTEMYHDLGDTIALQYGGSHLVNTMETYRKINQWTSHSRDMLEGLKRYYANSFADAEKQAAINLFLGVDNEAPEFRHVPPDVRRGYREWYTPAHLEPRPHIREYEARLSHVANASADFWQEYYRPSLFTDLNRHHAFKMTAVHQQVAMTSLPGHVATGADASVLSSASPQGSVVSLAPRKYTRSRLTSLGTMYSHRTESTVSPFTSRVPESPSKSGRRNAAETEGEPSSPTSYQRGAIIGGVRRWISLNRGDDNCDKEAVVGSAAAKDGHGQSSAVDKGAGVPSHEAPLAEKARHSSAWPTWEEITGAPSALPATDALLQKLMTPSVSAEEGKEYASWLNQFREVAFDGGPEHAVPEPAALLSASHAHQTTQSGIVSGSLLGSAATSELAKGLTLAGGGSTLLQVAHRGGRPSGPLGLGMSTRRPATQKQRQQVAEADALLYASEVAVASGNVTSLLSVHSLPTMAQDSANFAGATDPSKGQGLNHAPSQLEAAVVNYPLHSGALFAPPSDAKIRAYSHWLAGHAELQQTIQPQPVSSTT